MNEPLDENNPRSSPPNPPLTAADWIVAAISIAALIVVLLNVPTI